MKNRESTLAGFRILSVLCSRAANVDRFEVRVEIPPKRKKRKKRKFAPSPFDAEARRRQEAFKLRTAAWAGCFRPLRRELALSGDNMAADEFVISSTGR